MARLDPFDTIASHANPTIAYVRSLQKRDRRAAERAFVVEGKRLLADALAAGVVPKVVLVRAGAADRLPRSLPPGVSARLVAPAVFDRLSDVVTPQGVLAVVPFPELAPSAEATPLVLILDRLRDPGNLGTLLRAAAGAGATEVLLSSESVDPFNPKVVRAGMGAHFRVPIRELTPDVAAELRERVPLRVATRADAPVPYDRIDWRGPAAVIVGAEAAGVGAETAGLATADTSIPLAAGVESLNAAVAGAVVLFEAARQRRAASGR
ncbi:MAG TPA: RNA methyltransferase [Thermomicrobiales bacterium]|nr:RNA methyltransferase [Thermomicrobiales bacterium]